MASSWACPPLISCTLTSQATSALPRLPSFSQTSFSQPLLVVLEYCLAQSYKASGIWPRLCHRT